MNIEICKRCIREQAEWTLTHENREGKYDHIVNGGPKAREWYHTLKWNEHFRPDKHTWMLKCSAYYSTITMNGIPYRRYMDFIYDKLEETGPPPNCYYALEHLVDKDGKAT